MQNSVEPCRLLLTSLTLLLGVTGNLLIIFAILGYRKMKSPTNVFLASLAFADLLLCVLCLPVKVVGNEIQQKVSHFLNLLLWDREMQKYEVSKPALIRKP